MSFGSFIALGPEHEITIWEDREVFQDQGSAGSAPMSVSESDSEDGIFAVLTLVNLQYH